MGNASAASSGFAPSSDIVRAGWDLIVGNTSIRVELAEAAYLDFHDTFVAGASARDLCTVLQRHLSRTTWHWPWFQEWHQHFAPRGEVPYLWQDLAWAAAKSGGQPSDLVPLLEHSVSATIFRLRNLRQWAEMAQPLFPILAPVNDFQGKVEQRLAREMWPKIASGDWSVLPPFFPGDRTSLQVGFSPYFERWLERDAPDWIRALPPRPVTIST